MTSSARGDRPHAAPLSFYQSIYQTTVIALLSRAVSGGTVGISMFGRTVHVGKGPYICTVTLPGLMRILAMMLRPDYRVASHYVEGHWRCDEGKLYDFLASLMATPTPQRKFLQFASRYPLRDKILYALSSSVFRKKISIHYNTSPQFMKLLLGDRLEYTCAFFERNDESLETAQVRKMEAVIERLSIEGSHAVLDLGCGWGQIAEYVASRTGCSVTGVSISKGQIDYAKAHQSTKTRFLEADFYELPEDVKYDRIYSIGVAEHAGVGRLGEYFETIRRLLKPDGLALVHCIVRRQVLPTNSWIDDVVFPGVYMPALSDVATGIEAAGLTLEKAHIHKGQNYFNTLRAWETNLRRNKQAVLREIAATHPGQDAEKIYRSWEFYLCGARLAFNDTWGTCFNMQFVLSASGTSH